MNFLILYIFEETLSIVSILMIFYNAFYQKFFDMIGNLYIISSNIYFVAMILFSVLKYCENRVYMKMFLLKQ